MTNDHNSTDKTIDVKIDRILTHARSRSVPRSGRKEEMYAELRDEWIASNVSIRRKRQFAFTGIAATILVAIVLSVQFGNDTQSLTSPDAMLVRAMGSGSTINGRPIVPDNSGANLTHFQRGDVLNTGKDAAIAVDWRSNGSLRMKGSTSLTLLDGERVALTSGQAYYDSRSLFESEPTSIVIETPFGPIQHVGTQFLANVTASGVTISVREGRVTFGDAANNFIINTGESAYIAPPNPPVVTRISSTDDAWSWVTGIAPARDVDGRSTREIIDWVARETGHSVEYLDDQAAAFADRDQLRGIGDVEPLQALTVIPVATELEFDINSETIRIKLKDR